MSPHRDRLEVAERLRVNADRLDAVAGRNWRLQTACDMGCLTFDVGVGPVGQRRDGDVIEASNFRVIYRDLQAIDQRVTAARFDLDERGWFEDIVVPLDNPALLDRVAHWFDKLARDTVADVADLAALIDESRHHDT